MEFEKVILDSSDGFDRRILIRQGEPFACISDLYTQLGIARKTLMSIIENNEASFSGYIIKVNSNDLPIADNQLWRDFRQGSLFQKNTIYNFINETGYNLLIQKINPDTIKDASTRDIIIKHQRGMAEVFAKYRKSEGISTVNVQPTIHPSMRSPEQVCKDKIDLGLFIAESLNLPKQMMVSVSLAEATRETGVSFEQYQKCLPPAQDSYSGAHVSASELGKPYGDNGSKVNKLLQKLGYITKESGSWELTEHGKQFGGDYFHYTNEKNGHTGIYIQWPATMRNIIESHKHGL